MNMPDNNDQLDAGHDQQFLEWIMRYQDGTLTTEELASLSHIICHDPERRALFRRVQLQTAAINDVLRVEAIQQSDDRLQQDATDDELWNDSSRPGQRSPDDSRFGRAMPRSMVIPRGLMVMGVASLLLAIALVTFNRNGDDSGFVAEQSGESATEEPSVVLAEEVRATFFGKANLTPGASVVPRQDYMLQGGLVMLKFPSGATAIIEAPSIFRVESNDRLILNSGACSVYAPLSAEHFEVTTPVTTVSDRGTRYYVNVHDNNETEVHVIEGAADLHSIASHGSDAITRDTAAAVQQRRNGESVRLTDGEAVLVGGFVDYFGQRTPFNSGAYLRQLPDRLVDYQASTTANGSVGDLQSVTVQRDGQLQQYSIEDLVPIQVTRFRADPEPDVNGNLCGFVEKPQQPGDWLEDRSLATGMINFGGQLSPMETPVTFDGDSADPPGLGIRFLQPVVNHAGPDVVLFEIQSFRNSLDGDHFHVYPVSDRRDLRSFTVTRFDLTLDSPMVREVAPLWSHRFPYPIGSLEELIASDAPIKVDVGHMHFCVIGVGLDLSDLGYAEGELVEELFFQHAADAKASKVDPVFIAGLPPLRARGLQVTQLIPPMTDAPKATRRALTGVPPKSASLLSMRPVARRVR